MKPLFLDIETVTRDDAKERLVSKVTCPGNTTTPDGIAKWEATKRPEAEDKAFRDGALSALYGEIVCIGNCDDVASPYVYNVRDYPDEKKMLTCYLIEHHKEPRLFIGHNIAGFDIPYIWRRCKILGVELPQWWPSPNQPEWKCDNVFDTMSVWCGNKRGDFVSLKELCWALGIECSDESTGADVHDLHRAGQMDLIVEHCRSDVALVREVYRRLTT